MCGTMQKKEEAGVCLRGEHLRKRVKDGRNRDDLMGLKKEDRREKRKNE